MSIRKILSETENKKKGVQKSFRLTETSKIALEKIAKVGQVSQNEALNQILLESYEDLCIVQNIEEYLNGLCMNLNKGEYCGIYADRYLKVFDDLCLERFIITCGKSNLKDTQGLKIEHTIEIFGGEILLDMELDIRNIYELLDYGLNSSFEISHKTYEL